MASKNHDGRSNSDLVVSHEWSGPLPPPSALNEFEQVIPGAAERIFRMVELEQNHRIANEQTAINAQAADNKRRHWLGAGIAFAAIGASVFTAYIETHWLISVSLVGLPIAAIIGSILKK